MKKILLTFILFSLCFIYSSEAEAQRFIRWDGATRVVDSATQYTIDRELRLPLGLRVPGPAYFTGAVSITNSVTMSGANFLLSSGNFNVLNGNINLTTGNYTLNSVLLQNIFGETNDSNYWKRWSKFDTLLVGSGLFTFGSSTVSLSGANFYTGIIGTADFTVSHLADFTGSTVIGIVTSAIELDSLTSANDLLILRSGVRIEAGSTTTGFTVSAVSDVNILSQGLLKALTLTHNDSLGNSASVRLGHDSARVTANYFTINDSLVATRNWVVNNTAADDTTTYLQKYSSDTKQSDLTINGFLYSNFSHTLTAHVLQKNWRGNIIYQVDSLGIPTFGATYPYFDGAVKNPPKINFQHIPNDSNSAITGFGALGDGEANMYYNFKYDKNIHQKYKQGLPALSWTIGRLGATLQFIPSNTYDTDVQPDVWNRVSNPALLYIDTLGFVTSYGGLKSVFRTSTDNATKYTDTTKFSLFLEGGKNYMKEKLGIGTSTPYSKFHLIGDAGTNNGAYNANSDFIIDDAGTRAQQQFINPNSSVISFGDASTYNLGYLQYTNSTGILTISAGTAVDINSIREGGTALTSKYVQIANIYSNSQQDSRFLHSADSLKYLKFTDTTSTISTKQNVLNQMWGYVRDSAKVAYTDYNRTVTGYWSFSRKVTLTDSLSLAGFLLRKKNGAGWTTANSITMDTLYSTYVSTGNMLAGNITASNVAVSNSGAFNITSRFQFQSPSDGNLLMMNWAGNDFGRVMFGGTTSSFPALKRSGTGLHVRLADDSGYGALTAASFTTDTPSGGTAGTWKLGIYKTDGSSLVVSSTNYVQVDIGGTLYKLAIVN